MRQANERLDEIGVAGYIDDDLRQALQGFDVDAFHSIGLAGPPTPDLLRRINEAGVRKVAGFVHELGIAGPLSPKQLDELLSIGIDRVREIVHASVGIAPNAAEIMRIVRAASDPAVQG